MEMQDQSEKLIQRMGRRYFGVLIAVAGLLLLDQAVLQPALIRMTASAPLMNLAGRQRMFSQQVTKAALVCLSTDNSAGEPAQELRAALNDWKRVHSGLQFGDKDLKLPGTNSSAIQEAFAQLDPHFKAMTQAVEAILDRPPASNAAVQELLLHEKEYLRIMERIVALWESETQAQVLRLRQWGLAVTAMTLCLLGGLAILVLKPATTLIRDQVRQLAAREAGLRQARDELEARVRERTRELTEANQALVIEVMERERAEERSRRLQSDLAHASRVTSLGKLAAGLAHELNQPLGAIANFSEAIRALLKEVPPPWRELDAMSSRIRDAALRAGRIVGGMRNFVRSKGAVRRRERIQDLIREVLAFCDPELRRHGIQLQTQMADDAGTVLVDPIQIQQVLVNMIQNAVQAMSLQAHDTRTLTLAVIQNEDQLVIRVDDSGPGFSSPADLSEFVPFQSTKPDGLGLGLAISESLVAAHGGDLWIENRSNGARVQFSLPLAESCEHISAVDSLCRG